MLTYGKKFAMQKMLGVPADDLPEAEKEAIAHEAAKRVDPPSDEMKALVAQAEALYKKMGEGRPQPGKFKAWVVAAEKDGEDGLLRLVDHLKSLGGEA